jgi:hypothetical protein
MTATAEPLPATTESLPRESQPAIATIPTDSGLIRPFITKENAAEMAARSNAAQAAQRLADARANSPEIPVPEPDADYTEQRLYQVRIRIQELETELRAAISNDDDAKISRLGQTIERYQCMEGELSSRPQRPRPNGVGKSSPFSAVHELKAQPPNRARKAKPAPDPATAPPKPSA